MKKLAIIVDSSAGLTLEEQSEIKDLFVAPLSIIHDNKEYIDQIDITVEEIQDILSRNELIKTSQPSVGVALELYEKIQALGFDDILVISLSSRLSGTFNSFSAAADALPNNNVVIIDAMTLASPVVESIKVARALYAKNPDMVELKKSMDEYFKHTVSYVIPENLDQLKASGRISAGAAAVASLLRMKVLLRLANHGETIEKFTTGRTEKKLVTAMFDDISQSDFNPEEDMFGILHSMSEDRALALKKHVEALYPGVDIYMSFLPAALSGHAGNGTIVFQWFGNSKKYTN